MPGAPNPASPPGVSPQTTGSVTMLQLAQLAHQAGFKLSEIPTLIAIALAENAGLKVGAENHANKDGSVDYGLLQVNSVHGFDSQRLTSDPLYNLEAAHQIFESQGWGAWSTYNSGAYKSHLLAGQNAAQVFSGQSTGNRIAEVAAILTPFIGTAAATSEASGGAGAAAGGAGGAASKAATTAASKLASVPGMAVLAAIFDPHLLIRIVEMIGGVLLLLLGLRSLTGASNDPVALAGKFAGAAA